MHSFNIDTMKKKLIILILLFRKLIRIIGKEINVSFCLCGRALDVWEIKIKSLFTRCVYRRDI